MGTGQNAKGYTTNVNWGRSKVHFATSPMCIFAMNLGYTTLNKEGKYMYHQLPITDVYAREILDSRGNPTIEVEVLAGENSLGRASVPVSYTHLTLPTTYTV